MFYSKIESKIKPKTYLLNCFPKTFKNENKNKNPGDAFVEPISNLLNGFN